MEVNMLEYAKIIDEKLKTCIVGFDKTQEAIEAYEAMGMTEMEIEKGYDGNWYVDGYAPEEPPMTKEKVDRARIQYRKTHIDDRTLARQRKQANGTWTEEDERAYLALDAEVTAYIEEHFPYPVD